MEGGVNMTTRNVTAADFGSRYEAPGAELVRIACQFQSRILLKSGEMQVNAKSSMGSRGADQIPRLKRSCPM